MVESSPKLTFGEPDVGISLYLGDVVGKDKTFQRIECAFKHRFSDFIVNEIDTNNEVVWYRDENPNFQMWKQSNLQQTLPKDGPPQEEVKEEPKEPVGDGITLNPDILDELKDLLTQADYSGFLEFTRNLKAGTIEKDTFYKLDEIMHVDQKERRAKIHMFFRQKVKLYDTDTLIDGNNRQIRTFCKAGFSNKKRQKLQLNDRKPRDKSLPEYLQVVIQKYNVESMQAVHYVAKRIRKMGKQFQICGNKDKRGITSQRATIHRAQAEFLIRQQRCKDWDPKIKVGSFSRVFKPLRLGELNGNRFSVALRFIPLALANNQIAQQVESVRQNGFINYFGMQRFGTYNIHTHEIGKTCLRQDWQEVVRMLLVQHAEIDLEQKARKEKLVKKVFEEGDIEGAIDSLENRDRLEKSLLMVLKRNPHNYYNAFTNIARNSRFIYIHGYQSYVWNTSVSARLEKFGTQVLVGDLVAKGKLNEDDFEVQDEEADQSKNSQVELVTADNIKDYSIEDVVMPLIGHDIQLPQNEDLRAIILDILTRDKLALSDFAGQSTLKEMSASGSYRKIISKPEQVEFDIVEMQNENEDLLTPNYLTEADPTPQVNPFDTKTPVTKALRLKFSLKTSSYATMLLREVTRTSSAFSTQYHFSKAKTTNVSEPVPEPESVAEPMTSEKPTE